MKVIKHLSTRQAIWTSGLVMLLLGGCGSGGQRDGHKVFTYNESDGIATLDPAFAKNRSIMWAIHQLYGTLVETDADLHFVPGLARSWDVSADRRVWTFHLRTDVFFHDDPVFPGGKGRRLVAGDVVYSFNRILDAATASSGAWIFHGRIDTSGGAFEALDDSTFRLRLIRPFQPVLGLLSMAYCSVVPREAVETYGKDFRAHPCGT